MAVIDIDTHFEPGREWLANPSKIDVALRGPGIAKSAILQRWLPIFLFPRRSPFVSLHQSGLLEAPDVGKLKGEAFFAGGGTVVPGSWRKASP